MATRPRPRGVVSKGVDVETPLIELTGHPQELRPRRRAQGRGHEGLRRQGHRARRRQRRRQVDAHQGAVGSPALRLRRGPFEGSPVTLAPPRTRRRSASRSSTRTSPSARTSTSSRTCSSGARKSTSGMLEPAGDGEARHLDAAVVVGAHHEVGAAEGLVPVRRSAADRGHRPGRAAEGEGRHPRRADRGARRRPDRAGAGPRPAPGRLRASPWSSSATTSPTSSRWPTTSTCCTSARWSPSWRRRTPPTTTSSPTSPESRSRPRRSRSWRRRRSA